MSLGNDPIPETIVLVYGQDFIHEIGPPLGVEFPPTTTVELIIYDQAGSVVATWDATVDEDIARWEVDKAVADTINIPARFRVYVHYSDGSDYCWYAGPVARQG
ncbi:LtfC-like domain-containing protein [Nocardia flavorosea]|uniref:LtfC/p132/Gp6 beta-sandwich domain-containing protein n=1 Tax=Nocardia flavorosea TaxID=53429 RepID=A0A846YS80_9NOCA|nr:hypothetical protein [Nocardia flavorosea]NKY60334.1 hypothetical protein [Nocardia flavorosea]